MRFFAALCFLLLSFAPHPIFAAQQNDADPICANAPLTDREYAQELAEKGDMNAQYLLGIMIRKAEKCYSLDTPPIRRRINPSSSETCQGGMAGINWIRKAAEQGNIHAMGWLCESYAGDRGFSTVPADDAAIADNIKWCIKAAEYGHHYSQGLLGIVYREGKYLPQDNKKAFFWMMLGGWTTNKAADKLSAAEISEVEKQIKSWKPKPVSEQFFYSSSREIAGHHINTMHKLPINIPGLVCGGKTNVCKVEGVCGDLFGIRCPDEEKPYIIASKKSRSIVGQCTLEEPDGCKNFLPEDWKCQPPPNMPPALFAPQDVTPKASAHCDQARASVNKMAHILLNLERINLYVEHLPEEYDHAVKCHGREEECADSSNGVRDAYLNRIKKIYSAYPSSLTQEYFTDLFSRQMKRNLVNVIGDDCIPSTVINDAPKGHCIDAMSAEEGIRCSKKTIDDYIGDPKNLTFKVTIHVTNDLPGAAGTGHPYYGPQDGPDPRIVQLSLNLIRKTCPQLESISNVYTSIPLNVSKETIDEKIAEFMKKTNSLMTGIQSNPDYLPSASCNDLPRQDLTNPE